MENYKNNGMKTSTTYAKERAPFIFENWKVLILILIGFSICTNIVADGAVGPKALRLNNNGTKTWYNVHNPAWGYDPCSDYSTIKSATSFGGLSIGNVTLGSPFQIAGYAVIGWVTNGDFLAGSLQYKVWKQENSEPIYSTIDIGNYNNISGGASQVVCTSSNDRVVGYNNGTTDVRGNELGTFNFKVKGFGRIQYTGSGGGSFNSNDGSELTATFTVVAINPPTTAAVSISALGTTATLNWAKNTAGNFTMIVRYAKGATVTAPTQGTDYSNGSAIGAGTVVYKGNAITTDNPVDAGSEYDYYFYSENYSYYSTNVVKASIEKKTTKQTGDWNDVNTWTSNSVPAAGESTIVGHAMTVNENVANTATNITVAANGALNFGPSGALTVNGVLTNNGTLSMTNGGTINMAAGATWANGTGTFTPGTGTVVFIGNGTITGTNTFNKLIINGAVTNASTATIQSELKINAGGALSQAPVYANGATLTYNSGGEYNRNVEWLPNVTSGPGYPHHITVAGNGTHLKVKASKDNTFNAAGSLTIATGAIFDTDLGATDANSQGNVGINFGGDITNHGTLQWEGASSLKNMALKCASLINNSILNMSTSPGGDIHLMGNLTNNGTWNYNGRAIKFVGNAVDQTIGGTSTDPFSIPFVEINNVGGRVILNKNLIVKGYSSGGDGVWALKVLDGTLDLNGYSLEVSEATKTAGMRFDGTGKIRGNANSSITLLGAKHATAGAGSMIVDNSGPGTTNIFKSFTYARTGDEVAFSLEGNIQLTEGFQIQAGAVVASGNIELGNSATGSLSAANTSAALTLENLILGKSSSSSAQFLRNGRTLTINNKVKVKVSFDQTGKWHFISFPFDISAVENSEGGAALLNTDYGLGQYNAAKRAQRISGWESSSDNPMTAYKGYIINRRSTGPTNKDLYFITNEKATHASFDANNNVSLAYTTHPGGLSVNFGWNFVAHPLVANGQSTLAEGEFHYGYDGNSDQYTVGYGNSGARNSFDAYFIKTAEAGTLSVNLSAPQGAARKKNSTLGNFQLALRHNNMEYYSVIRMHENATFAYDERYDAPYSSPWNASTARFYSLAGTEAMALNSVGGEGEITLGARFPTKGDYEISWQGSIQNYSAQLLDSETAEIVDMRYTNNYRFKANNGDNNSRFKIRITADVSTHNKLVYNNNNVRIRTLGSDLLMDGLQQGDNIKLYDSTGRTLHTASASANSTRIQHLQKGIYIIEISNNITNLHVRRSIVM